MHFFVYGRRVLVFGRGLGGWGWEGSLTWLQERGRLSVLHSLKGLGLGGHHEGRGCGPRHVPGVEFGSDRGLRGLGGHHCSVGWWGLGEAWRLSVFLESRHSGWAGAVTTLGAVVHHGLSGGGTGARAARTG